MSTHKLFYITAKDTNRLFFMVGPFKHHEDALAMVDLAMQQAAKIDPRSWWMEWGTTACNDVKACPLNDVLGTNKA